MAGSQASGASLAHIPGTIDTVARDSFGWLTQDTDTALTAIAVGVAVYVVFWGLRWAAVKALGPGRDVASWRGFVARIVRRTRSFFIAAFAAWAVTHVIAPPGPVQRAIDVVFTIAFAIQGAIWARAIALALVERRAANAEDAAGLASAVNIIRVLINFVVWFLALILILSNLGVNVTALVAGLGVGGIAIGLAAQGIFSDLFAALAILFDRPFRVGDTISFGSVTGAVEAIGLKTTRIRAISGEQVIVSNAKLLDQQIGNLQRIVQRRVVMAFGVIYQTPAELVAAIPSEIETIVASRPKCRFDRAHFVNFAASSLDFEVVFFVLDAGYGAMLDEKQAVGLALLKRFGELGIDFAYPSQTSFTAGPDGRVIDPRDLVPPVASAAQPRPGTMPRRAGGMES